MIAEDFRSHLSQIGPKKGPMPKVNKSAVRGWHWQGSPSTIFAQWRYVFLDLGNLHRRTSHSDTVTRAHRESLARVQDVTSCGEGMFLNG